MIDLICVENNYCLSTDDFRLLIKRKMQPVTKTVRIISVLIFACASSLEKDKIPAMTISRKPILFIYFIYFALLNLLASCNDRADTEEGEESFLDFGACLS